MTQTNHGALALEPYLDQIFTDDAKSMQCSSEETSDEALTSYVMLLEAKLEASSNAAELYEVDSQDGSIYRVWKGMKVIGRVLRCPHSGNWIAELCSGYKERCYPDSELAVAAVVKAWEVA